MNKMLYVAGALLIAGFCVVMLFELQKAGTPYVTTLEEARQMQGKRIQFVGAIQHSKTDYDAANHELVFELKDKQGKTVEVRYDGAKPGNFDSARDAVVTGLYSNGKFTASRVLLNCPSKYQNQ